MMSHVMNALIGLVVLWLVWTAMKLRTENKRLRRELSGTMRITLANSDDVICFDPGMKIEVGTVESVEDRKP